MKLHRLRSTLRADLRGDTERGAMVRSAGITAALKVGATAIAFGASLLYARALGPHGYGLYAYVIAWATLLAIPVGMGIPGYLVREGAKMSASLRWMRRWADQRVLAGETFAVAVEAAQRHGTQWQCWPGTPTTSLRNWRQQRVSHTP